MQHQEKIDLIHALAAAINANKDTLGAMSANGSADLITAANAKIIELIS